MKREWQPSTAAEAVFEPFVQKALSVCSFLSEFGFDDPSVLVHPPECALVFRKNSLLITVHYEYGGMPWLKVAERLRGRWSGASIEKWLAAHCPESRINRRSFKDWVDALEKYSSVLRSCFSSR